MHRHEPGEVYHVLEGEFAFYVGDGLDGVGSVRRFTAGAGEVVPLAGGVPHTIRNESGADAVAFVVHAPGPPMEGFTRAAAALAAAGPRRWTRSSRSPPRTGSNSWVPFRWGAQRTGSIQHACDTRGNRACRVRAVTVAPCADLRERRDRHPGRDLRQPAAVRLVLGATAAAVAALVLVGLLVAVVAARPTGAATAFGLGLGAAGAAALAVGLLVVARAGALARRPSGRARAAAVLTRCLLAATVGAVAMVVVGVVAVSATRAAAPGLGAGAAAVLLVGLAALAGRTRRRLSARRTGRIARLRHRSSRRSAPPSPLPSRAVRRNPARRPAPIASGHGRTRDGRRPLLGDPDGAGDDPQARRAQARSPAVIRPSHPAQAGPARPRDRRRRPRGRPGRAAAWAAGSAAPARSTPCTAAAGWACWCSCWPSSSARACGRAQADRSGRRSPARWPRSSGSARRSFPCCCSSSAWCS